MRRFMLIFGLLRSVFDYLTFVCLLLVLRTTQETFHKGWLESPSYLVPRAGKCAAGGATCAEGDKQPRFGNRPCLKTRAVIRQFPPGHRSAHVYR
jgi:hypothetical protein